MRYLSFARLPFAQLSARRANFLLVALAACAAGLVAGTSLRPQFIASAPPAPAPALSAIAPAFAGTAGGDLGEADDAPLARRLDPSLIYPAEIIRVIDGDTFEARVRVWPGLDVDTKVRLRGGDAAELHARCAGELAQAQAARAALTKILAEGGVTVSRVGVDKYGGRVDAAIATRVTPDVSAALLGGGYARAYDGGKRQSWCG